MNTYMYYAHWIGEVSDGSMIKTSTVNDPADVTP